jgi:hypothetical protein
MKATGPTVALFALASTTQLWPFALVNNLDGNTYSAARTQYALDSHDRTGAWHVFRGCNASGVSAIFLDGSDTVAVGNPHANPAGNFDSLGWRAFDSNYSDGDIAEIIFYNRQLTTTEDANINKYLGAKYGIAVAGGGTVIDPSTVAGLVGWWKADSLL